MSGMSLPIDYLIQLLEQLELASKEGSSVGSLGKENWPSLLVSGSGT